MSLSCDVAPMVGICVGSHRRRRIGCCVDRRKHPALVGKTTSPSLGLGSQSVARLRSRRIKRFGTPQLESAYSTVTERLRNRRIELIIFNHIATDLMLCLVSRPVNPLKFLRPVPVGFLSNL